MVRRAVTGLVVLCSACLAPSVAAQDAGQATFDQLFGAKVKQVSATRATDDDLALANQLLETAGTLKPSEALLPHLLDSAFELAGRSSAGFETAKAAMLKLSEVRPDRADEARGKIAKLIRDAYRKARGDLRRTIGEQLVEQLDETGQQQIDDGDARAAIVTYREANLIARSIRSAAVGLMRARLEQATELVRVYRDMDAIRQKLEATPSDKQLAGDLVLAYVIKLNQPEKAKPYLSLLADDLKAVVTLALGPTDKRSADDAVKLGQWYVAQSAGERGLIKLAALEHARDNLQHALSFQEGTTKTVATLKAELALKDVEAQIEKLNEQLGVKGRWVDLTKAFAKRVAAKDWEGTGDGDVEFANGVLRMRCDARGTRYLHVDVGADDVVLSVEVKKLKGSRVQFGVGSRPVGNYQASIAGYQTVEVGRWLNEGGYSLLGQFSTGKGVFTDDFNELRMAVVGGRVMLFVDGKLVFKADDTKITDRGGLFLAVRNADADFRKPRFLKPMPSQVKAMVSEAAEKRQGR